MRILGRISKDPGLAIVVINHCRREQTLLRQVLSRRTRMPVEVINAGTRPKKNGVFIIPGNHDLALSHGRFAIRPRSKPTGWPNIISLFLNSLAQQWTGPVVGVILSGRGCDGTDALNSLKAVGGITMAQDLLTAEQQDMPRNAIQGGYVDFELSPEGIGDELNRIADRHRSLQEIRSSIPVGAVHSSTIVDSSPESKQSY